MFINKKNLRHQSNNLPINIICKIWKITKENITEKKKISEEIKIMIEDMYKNKVCLVI